MTPVDELPTRSVKPRPTMALVGLVLTFCVALECLLLRLVAGRFTPMFEDFEARLPTLTLLFVGWLGYAFACLISTAGVGLSVLGWTRAARHLEFAGVLIVIGVLVLLPMLALWSFYLPILQLSNAIEL